MLENMPVVALVSIFSILLICGTGVSFLLGRRTARIHSPEQDDEDIRLPERVVKELVRCLELGDYVARDAELLTSVYSAHPGSTPRPLQTALQQLLKTTKSLLGRLDRVGAAARVARPATNGPTFGLSASGEPDDLGKVTSLASRSSDEASNSAGDLASPERINKDALDARRFPRSAFRGSAWATIYPQHSCPGREPLRCEVLTRDLSCGGIGIAHSEPLLPKQIVILDALGKLLVSEVRWCRRVDENFYVAGCRLVKTSA